MYYFFQREENYTVEVVKNSLLGFGDDDVGDSSEESDEDPMMEVNKRVIADIKEEGLSLDALSQISQMESIQVKSQFAV